MMDNCNLDLNISGLKSIIAKATHDIRSPLATLAIISSISTTMSHKEINTIKNALSRIGGILINLEQFGYNGRINEKARINVANTILKLISEKQCEYHDSYIKFRPLFSNNVDNLSLIINPSDLERMLSNLINNAVEAYDGAPGTIFIHLNSQENVIKITIEDHGKGMSRELVNKIKNNQKVTCGKTNGKGIGMGQVQDTLRNNNGKLDIESSPLNGTKIILSFLTTNCQQIAN